MIKAENPRLEISEIQGNIVMVEMAKVRCARAYIKQ